MKLSYGATWLTWSGHVRCSSDRPESNRADWLRHPFARSAASARPGAAGRSECGAMEDTMKTLFTIHAFVSWAFGLALLLIPGALLGGYGVMAVPSNVLLARLLGGALLGLGVMAWLAHRAAPSEGLRAVIWGDAVISIVGCLVSIHGVLSGASNAAGWMNAVIFGVFAVGFGALVTTKATTGKTTIAAHT